VSSSAAKKLELNRQEAEWRRCKRDPAYWLRTYCWTFDAHDKANPYKPMVDGDELPYLDLVVRLYLSERRLIFLKSRQLRITWICCALDLWEAMFTSAAMIPINAYKEDDAKDIIERCRFIYEGNPAEPDRAPGLPKWMRDRAPMIERQKPPEMEFPTQMSLIRAIPEGAENMRGKTIRRQRFEEARSQPNLEATCQGVLPALQKVGQAVFVSSAGPGYYEQLVFDKSDPGDPPPRIDIETGIKGVTMWRNARNKYLVVRIHYSADPAKREAKWLETVTEGMPLYQVAMEYEIDFSARGGEPALSFFVENEKLIVVPPREIPKWWPRFAAADYGVTSPYSCHFYAVMPDGRLLCYWEYYSPGALGDHLGAITGHEDWPLIQLYILDKSCWAATQQASESVAGRALHGVRSIADLHQDFGVYPTPATVTGDQVKVSALEKEWARPKLAEKAASWAPKTLIVDSCSNLIRELRGIKWAKLAPTAVHWQEKLIDRDNHAFDDLCYGVLHYRQAGMDPHPAVADYSSEEIQAAHSKQRQLAHVQRVESRLEGVEMVPDSYGGDEPYGLVH